MRFLVDAQLPPALAEWLRKRGHEAEHVFEIDMVGAVDAAVAAHAEVTAAIIITKDEDFVLLRLPERFQLLWLRCGNSSKKALLEWLEPRWPEVERLLREDEGMIEVR